MPALIDEPLRRKETPKMATTTLTIVQLLGMTATAYGVLAALSVLLQTRQMLARRASCEVSGRFFALYAGGYAIWLLYGLSVGNVPLTIVDGVGVLCGGLTLAVTLSLRGSLFHPTTWTSCSAIPLSEVSSEPSATVTREELEPGDSTVPRAAAVSPPCRRPARNAAVAYRHQITWLDSDDRKGRAWRADLPQTFLTSGRSGEDGLRTFRRSVHKQRTERLHQRHHDQSGILQRRSVGVKIDREDQDQ